jgi:hypothetical protein
MFSLCTPVSISSLIDSTTLAIFMVRNEEMSRKTDRMCRETGVDMERQPPAGIMKRGRPGHANGLRYEEMAHGILRHSWL